MKTTLAIAAAFAAILSTQAAFAGPDVTRENQQEEAVAMANARYDDPLALFAVAPETKMGHFAVTKLNPVENPHWGPAQDATDN